MSPTARWFVDQYGDQAYHKSIEFAAIASVVGEEEVGAGYAAAAHELRKLGYARYPKHRALEEEEGA